MYLLSCLLKRRTRIFLAFVAFLCIHFTTQAQFTLHSNNVTILCTTDTTGATGTVDGTTYTKRTKDQITTGNAATTCTCGITDMSELFKSQSTFNADISHWDVSSVTDMSFMFHENNGFNQNIGDWNVSSVTDMNNMFAQAHTFNQYIGDWDVSNVTNMNSMFALAITFNQDIGDWDVSNVTNMFGMFFGARAFDRDIGEWDVSNVTTMQSMFSAASNFIPGLSTVNYSSLLSGWSERTLKMNVIFHGGDSRYCAGEERDVLTDTFKWFVADKGKATNCVPPTAISLTSNALPTLSPINTTVGTLSATDSDQTSGHRFTLVSGDDATDNDKYKIVSDDTLKLAVAALAAATTHSIRIKVINNDGATYSQAFTVSIEDSAPTAITLSSGEIRILASINTTVGTLSATDTDQTSGHVFTLVSGAGATDNNNYKIVDDTLKLAVAAPEAATIDSIRIQVTDEGGATYSQAFTVSIVGSAPTAISLSSSKIPVLTPENTTVGTLSATDADLTDVHVFTLVSGAGATDNANYKIISDTTLQLAVAAPAEATIDSIRIKVTDKDGATFEQILILMVEEPVGIEEENNSVRAYPNPVKTRLKVEKLSPRESITLTDVSGVVVATTQADASGKATLLVKKIAAGVYFVKTHKGTMRVVIE